MIDRHHLPVAVYYEHPEWFRPLFAELDRRSIQYVRIDAGCHGYDPTAADRNYALLVNRMSASAYLRGNVQGIFFTRDYLAHLERIGTRVINGCKAFSFEISKAAQLALLHSLGLATPRSRIVNCAIEAISAAEEIGFPIIIKPNIGGRGAGIIRLDSAPELARAAASGRIGFGIDSTALVQEFFQVRGGHITRVETLGGKFLYAIKIYPSGESFNLCPAEICRTEEEACGATTVALADGPETGLKVEAFTPPQEIIGAVEKIVAAAQIEVGSVEYLIDDRDGTVVYYDINALSNFVANAPQILGFDPHVRLVDYLERQTEGI
jgi:Carbamoyl-phosphate synthase L chain, ATP binding domain